MSAARVCDGVPGIGADPVRFGVSQSLRWLRLLRRARSATLSELLIHPFGVSVRVRIHLLAVGSRGKLGGSTIAMLFGPAHLGYDTAGGLDEHPQGGCIACPGILDPFKPLAAPRELVLGGKAAADVRTG